MIRTRPNHTANTINYTSTQATERKTVVHLFPLCISNKQKPELVRRSGRITAWRLSCRISQTVAKKNERVDDSPNGQLSRPASHGYWELHWTHLERWGWDRFPVCPFALGSSWWLMDVFGAHRRATEPRPFARQYLFPFGGRGCRTSCRKRYTSTRGSRNVGIPAENKNHSRRKQSQLHHQTNPNTS